MSYRSVLNDFLQTLLSDSFGPITYFSWMYCHWTGSNVICGIIFSTVVIVAHLTTWIYLDRILVLELANGTSTSVSVFIYYCMMVAHTLSIPVLVTVWMIRGHRRVQRVILAVATVDEKLSKFGEFPSKNSAIRTSFRLLWFPLTLIVTIVSQHNSLSSFEPHNIRKDYVSLFLALYYCLIVGSYVQCFFGCSVLLIGDRYRAINAVLKRISQEYSCDLESSRQITFYWITTIRELRAVHRKLFFATETISEAFGFQLLIITIVSLMRIIIVLYTFYLENVLSCGTVSSHATGYLVWCVMHVGPLCITAICCSRTSAEEKYTEVLLQEMCVSNDNLRMEISTFSLQLIHYELHFSVCGFYDIDLPFIRTIVGTIATYLVILIQIGTVSHSCRNILISRSENITNSAY